MSDLQDALSAYLAGDNSLRPQLLEARTELFDIIKVRLPHETDRNQWRLLILLGQLNLPGATDILIPFLSHPRNPIKSVTAQILGTTTCKKALSALLDELERPESAVHIWVVQALGNFQDEQVVEALTQVLSSAKSEVVLYTAIQSLGEVADSTAIPVIEPFLQHHSHHVRRYSKEAIATLRHKTKGHFNDS